MSSSEPITVLKCNFFLAKLGEISTPLALNVFWVKSRRPGYFSATSNGRNSSTRCGGMRTLNRACLPL